MHPATIDIEGMSCGHCVASVNRALGELDGVEGPRGDGRLGQRVERSASGYAGADHGSCRSPWLRHGRQAELRHADNDCRVDAAAQYDELANLIYRLAR